MTNKEAIKRLKWVQKRICDITYSPESFEAINLAIEALKDKGYNAGYKVGFKEGFDFRLQIRSQGETYSFKQVKELMDLNYQLIQELSELKGQKQKEEGKEGDL